jgi:nitroreductase
MGDVFAKNPQLIENAAKRNSSLQGLILAARGPGLDCGPMSGFDQAKVDQQMNSFSLPESAKIVTRSFSQRDR